MRMTEALAALRTRWLLVVAGIVAGLIVAFAYLVVAPAVYSSTALSVVRIDSSKKPDQMQAAASASRQLAVSYVPLATSSKVLSDVIDQLDLDVTPEQLAETLEVRSPVTNKTTSAVVSVTASDVSPELAKSIANEVMASLNRAIEVDTSPSPLQTFQTASAASEPTSPNQRLAIALGVLLGLATGIAAALAFERFRGTVRRRDASQSFDDRLVIAVDDSSAGSGVGNHLIALASETVNAFVLTAADDLPVTPFAHHAALEILARGRSVVLVGDVSGEESLSQTAEVGDLDSFIGSSPVAAGITPTDGRVNLITVRPDQLSDETFLRPEVQTLVEELGALFDVVLVVAAPVATGLAAIRLSKSTAGAILVVTDGATRKGEYRAALSRLRLYGAPVAATVIKGDL